MSALINKVVAFERKCGDAILSANGSRVQFELCIVLVSLIPLFALAFLAIMDVHIMLRLLIFSVCLPVVAIGYAIVSKYPRAIKILRQDLSRISKEDLPEKIDLKTSDADIKAIAESLDDILVHTKERIDKIKQQQESIVEMERERVMYESIGTACHHMGQPAAVLSNNLRMMKNHPDKIDTEELTKECSDATDEIVKILHKLNEINEYKTTTYMPGSESGHGDVNILDL